MHEAGPRQGQRLNVRITGGAARGIPLLVPPSSRIRPTSDRVRGALFQLLGREIVGARVLDLYAGTGALGIEALSRGAASADFVEADARLCRIVARNLQAAGFTEHGHVHHARAERALEFLEGPYQMVLMDPPYSMRRFSQALDRLAHSVLVDDGGIVAVEHSNRVGTENGYGSLRKVRSRRYGDTTVSMYRAGEA